MVPVLKVVLHIFYYVVGVGSFTDKLLATFIEFAKESPFLTELEFGDAVVGMLDHLEIHQGVEQQHVPDLHSQLLFFVCDVTGREIVVIFHR